MLSQVKYDGHLHLMLEALDCIALDELTQEQFELQGELRDILYPEFAEDMAWLDAMDRIEIEMMYGEDQA
jgi:hypothetical protein